MEIRACAFKVCSVWVWPPDEIIPGALPAAKYPQIESRVSLLCPPAWQRHIAALCGEFENVHVTSTNALLIMSPRAGWTRQGVVQAKILEPGFEL